MTRKHTTRALLFALGLLLAAPPAGGAEVNLVVRVGEPATPIMGDTIASLDLNHFSISPSGDLVYSGRTLGGIEAVWLQDGVNTKLPLRDGDMMVDGDNNSATVSGITHAFACDGDAVAGPHVVVLGNPAISTSTLDSGDFVPVANIIFNMTAVDGTSTATSFPITQFAVNPRGAAIVAVGTLVVNGDPMGSALFNLTNPEELVLVMKEGGAAPDGAGTFTLGNTPVRRFLVVNAAGDVAFFGRLNVAGPVNGSNDTGIWIHDETNGLTLAIREDEIAAGFKSDRYAELIHIFGMDSNGQFAFLAHTRTVSGGPDTGKAIWVHTPGAMMPTQCLIATDDPAPGFSGGETIAELTPPNTDHAYTESGLLTFLAEVNTGDRALYVGRPGQIELLAVEGEHVPIRGLENPEFGGQFEVLGVNDDGQVLFEATVSFDPPVGTRVNGALGIFLTDVTGAIHALAVQGQNIQAPGSANGDMVDGINPNNPGNTNYHNGISDAGTAVFMTEILLLNGASNVFSIYSAFAVPEDAGDYSGDRFVGVADLDLVLANWGVAATGNLEVIDGNGDGVIGQPDLQIVIDNWGTTYDDEPLFDNTGGGI